MATIQSATSPESAGQIRDFLQTHYSGVLATCNASGEPHAAVVYFSVEEDLCLLFATKTETEKFKNTTQSDKVAFVCYDEKLQTTVQISGRVEKVEDPASKQVALDAIYRFSSELSGVELPPIEKLFAGEYVVLRIVPKAMKMAVFLRPDSEGADTFDTVTFA